jgi:hypothetical protein
VSRSRRKSGCTAAAAKLFAKAGHHVSFTIRATGYPRPRLTWTGPLPKGLKLTGGHSGTAVLSGTVSAHAAHGRYKVKITATSTSGNATQTFTNTVT